MTIDEACRAAEAANAALARLVIEQAGRIIADRRCNVLIHHAPALDYPNLKKPAMWKVQILTGSHLQREPVVIPGDGGTCADAVAKALHNLEIAWPALCLDERAQLHPAGRA